MSDLTPNLDETTPPGTAPSTWAVVAPSGTTAPAVRLPDDSPEAAAGPPGPTASAGRYEILDEIARGGMGAVLRGRDPELNRELAIKVLLERFRDNPEVLRRFFEEAQIGGQLQHPGIVPIYDLGVFPDDRPFFAMKLVKGRTLSALLKERSSPADDLPRFVGVFHQIAQTVAYAHSKRVIHRDLKPPNVMVGAFGEVQVMDWGLAKVLGGGDSSDVAPAETEAAPSLIETARTGSESDATSAGSKMGTPAYMAPEQARGEVDRTDERADVFGLGAILCEVLTGSPAYTGRNGAEVMRKAEFADISDALARLGACGADPELVALAKKCLAREPEDRPRDASGVALAVADHLAGVQDRLRKAEIARAEAAARAVAERAKRKLTAALAAAVILAGAVGGGSFLAFRLDRQAKLAEADRIIGDALARAESARDEARRSGPEDTNAWPRALRAAEGAHEAMTGRPVRADLASRVAATLADAQRAEADRRLADRLDEARLRGAAVKNGGYDGDAKIAAYAEAFREASLSPGDRPAAEIVARLSGSAEAPRIAGALDDWSRNKTAAPIKTDLIAVAEGIDPANNPIRRAIRSKDRMTLARLTTDDAARRLSPAAAMVVAKALIALGMHDEAIGVLSAARVRRPGDFWLNQDLGMALLEESPSRPEEASRFLTAAAALRPESPGVHLNLGSALSGSGRKSEAEKEYREAIALDPKYARVHDGLGILLSGSGRLAEAEKEFREAIALDPKDARVHVGLGVLLSGSGRKAEAEKEFREAIALDPKLAMPHSNLGLLLSGSGRRAEAEEEFRGAIRLDPKLAPAHANLGSLLSGSGRLAEAEKAYREAIALDPKLAMPHSNLGGLLAGSGRRAEAEEEFREAIALDPKLAEAHCNLGIALRGQGRLREALEELKRGDELGSARPDWRYPSDPWVKECAAMVALEDRLPALLRGQDSPKDDAERLKLGQLGYDTRRFAASVRFWGEALDHDPRLGDDRRTLVRYNGACSAALAASGAGVDDPKPDQAARDALRGRALGWLREDLKALEAFALSAEKGNREVVAQTLAHWKGDADLASVRDRDALAKLPEAERKAWEALWADVETLRAKVRP